MKMTWLNSCEIDVCDQRSTMETGPEKASFCPLCRDLGQKSRLRLFQINAKEALTLCSKKSCTYPMGQKPSEGLIVKRSASLVNFGQKRKGSSLQENPKSPKLLKTSSQTINKRPHLAHVHLTNGRPNNFVKTVPLQTPDPNHCQLSQHPPHYAKYKRETAELVVKFPTAASPVPENLPKSKPVLSVLNPVSQTITINAPRKDSSAQLDSDSKSADAHVNVASGYLQWRNRDKLCWLDVIMCCLVHSHWIKEYCSHTDSPDSSLVRLVKSYRDAMALFRVDLTSTTGSQVLANNRHSLQTSNGNTSDNNNLHAHSGPQTEKYFSEICVDQAETIMARGQDNMWRHLQPKLRCIQGEENSAVCGLMAVLSTEPALLQQLCKVTYRLEAKCAMCGNERINDLEKRVMVFPSVKPEFTMSRPQFHGTCDNCKAVGQRVLMNIQRYPVVLFSHFVGGLPNLARLAHLDFVARDGSRYRLKAVVQYKRDPDHFVAWIRDFVSDLWMECDDTKTSPCEFDCPEPGFPLGQVHLVMWEKLTDEVATPIVHQSRGCTVPQILQPDPRTVSVKPATRESAMPMYSRPSSSVTVRSDSHQAASGEHQTGATSQESTGAQTCKPVASIPGTIVSTGRQSAVPLECRRKYNESLESHSKFYRKPSQAELDRVARMRQRFQQHKSQSGDKSSIDSISRSETPPLQGMFNNIAPVPSEAPPVTKRRSALPSNTEQVSLLMPDHRRLSKKSPDNLKSALAKSEVKTKLKDSLSHRVLKYLPDHVSLPFELTVLQETKEPDKPKAAPSGTFSGYVPKGGFCKAESNQKDVAKVNEKKAAKHTQKTPARRKNVQFNLDVADQTDSSIATAMFLGGSIQKSKPALITANLDQPVCLEQLGKLVKDTESTTVEPQSAARNCSTVVENGCVGSSDASNGSIMISGLTPIDSCDVQRNGVGLAAALENVLGRPVPLEACTTVCDKNQSVVTPTQVISNPTIFQAEPHKLHQSQRDTSQQNGQQNVHPQQLIKPLHQQIPVPQLPKANSQWTNGHHSNATPQDAHAFNGSPHGPIRLYAPGTQYHMNVIPAPQRLISSYPILAQTTDSAAGNHQSSLHKVLTPKQVQCNPHAGMDISFNCVSEFQTGISPGYKPSDLHHRLEHLVQSPSIL